MQLLQSKFDSIVRVTEEGDQMAEKTYTELKTLRLTPEENKLLKVRCEAFHMKEAEYFRFLLSQKPSDYPEIRVLIKSLINEVNHIGRNINQIVHNNNSELYSEADKQRLMAYIKKLNVTLEEAVHSLGN